MESKKRRFPVPVPFPSRRSVVVSDVPGCALFLSIRTRLFSLPCFLLFFFLFYFSFPMAPVPIEPSDSNCFSCPGPGSDACISRLHLYASRRVGPSDKESRTLQHPLREAPITAIIRPDSTDGPWTARESIVFRISSFTFRASFTPVRRSLSLCQEVVGVKQGSERGFVCDSLRVTSHVT
jgi:hypothetical protein